MHYKRETELKLPSNKNMFNTLLLFHTQKKVQGTTFLEIFYVLILSDSHPQTTGIWIAM